MKLKNKINQENKKNNNKKKRIEYDKWKKLQDEIENKFKFYKLLQIKQTVIKINVNQIWKKNKSNSCFEKLKALTW